MFFFIEVKVGTLSHYIEKNIEILKILQIITKKFIIFVMVLQLQIEFYDITC